MRRFRATRGATLLLAGLLAACGGVEPSLGDRGQPLDVAPTWMVELDLPGCACAEMKQADRLLLHPFDDQLVVAIRDGAASCVGARPRVVARDATSVKPGLSLGNGGVDPVAQTVAGDDPVPIIPDDTAEGGSGSGGNSNDEGDDDSRGDDGPPTPGDTVKLSIGGDDPVPIRDDKVVPVKLSHSAE